MRHAIRALLRDRAYNGDSSHLSRLLAWGTGDVPRMVMREAEDIAGVAATLALGRAF